MAPADVRELERFVGLPGPLCELLVRRGFGPDEEARRFLRPEFSHLHDPGALTDLDAAADRVERAVERGETVLVHGDYDVDGMTGAALLALAIEELGGRAVPHVPHRTRDGYDLGPAGVERARAAGARLIVTADCGVRAHEAVERAGALGIDVVITDHHRPGSDLPPALAVVDPSREDDAYPFGGLAGVGVAFKLVQELYTRKELGTFRINQHLDLVALGTIADQAPLLDENRALARFGLRALDRSRKPGLRALCHEARVGRWSVARAADVAYRVAPRLNSVGRIGDAGEGLRLLLSRDHQEAERLAARLERHNLARRETDRAILEEARGRLASEFAPDRDAALVMWGERWHAGVLGIVASRLVEELHRPVVLIGVEGERGRGSGRSVPGFHLFRALAGLGHLFERFGGHAQAAGFEIRRERLEELRTGFREVAAAELDPAAAAPRLEIEQELGPAAVTPALARAMTYLEPFGEGNPLPRFLARGVRLRSVEPVGADGRHARVLLADGAAELEGIAFGQAEELARHGPRDRLDVAYELHVESGPRGLRPQAHVVAVRPAG